MTMNRALLAAALAMAPAAARAQSNTTTGSTTQGTSADRGQTTSADRADPRANPPSGTSADKPADKSDRMNVDRERTARSDEGKRSDKALTDEQLLRLLHHENEEEIKAGQLAQQKGSSPAVKDYGLMLVNDHTKADKQVQQVAAKMHVDLSKHEMDAKHMEEMKVHQSKMDQIRKMTGKEFDRAFAQAMSADHQHLIDTVKATQPNAKGDMKTLIDGLMPELQKHKDVADQIASSVRDTASVK